MLKRRLISAAIIVSVMVVLLWLDHYLGRKEVWGMPGLVLALVTTLTLALPIRRLSSTTARMVSCALWFTNPCKPSRFGSFMAVVLS